MEVHHHSHHPAPGASRARKWSHYFWEFLMLFLAVFCGFLAEYQLEHKIEKERGKQYIRSFYKDLITDTATFSQLINSYEIKLAAMKTQSPCFDSVDRDQGSGSCFWNLVINSVSFPDLIYTDRTLQQLKNAGGLRLLAAADADSILLYDNMLRSYKTAEETFLQEAQSEIRNTLFSMLNHKSLNGDPTVSILYGNNKELLNKYWNQLFAYTEACQERLKALMNIRKKTIDLIEYFKTKHKLE